jgi:hypothetical protein
MAMKKNNDRTRIDTTLGELIAAASEVAFEHCEDTREAYELTGLVLVEILKKRFCPVTNSIETFGTSGAWKSHLN